MSVTPFEKRAALCGGLLCLIARGLFRAAMALGIRAEPLRRAGLALGTALCRFWSLLPMPAAELVWIMGIASALGASAYLVKKRGAAGLAGALCRLLAAGGVIYALFSFVYLVQYSSPPLSSLLSMTVNKYTTEQLAEVAGIVAEELNNYALNVPRDGEGLFAPSSYALLGEKTLESYESGSMAALYSRGAKTAPKQSLFLGKIMSYLNLAGYYFPITGESVVSRDIIETSVPFTIAHEEAHSFGIGPEKEANFAAFLCCVESGDPELAYSGLFNGYIYLNNALYYADPSLWRQVYDSLSQPVLADLEAKRRHLERYEGAVNDFGTKVNDSFIKATGQPEGVRSYGLVADLIISYYLER